MIVEYRTCDCCGLEQSSKDSYIANPISKTTITVSTHSQWCMNKTQDLCFPCVRRVHESITKTLKQLKEHKQHENH